jgi:hypothetical protein
VRRTAFAIVGAAAAAAALIPLAPASAASSVVVHGTAFTSTREAQLSYVGCAQPFHRSDETLQPYIGIGPGKAPAGKRSLGYDLDGGNAIGSLHYVSSMASTTVAGMSVHAPGGASGVAYAGYQEPADRGTGRVWFGRVPLSVAGGGWHRVDVAQSKFTWTKYDMLTQQATGKTGGRSGISAFIKAHGGDGPGFFTIGFGCDGSPFNMDAWRIGRPGAVTTYDLEGLKTVTTISGSATKINKGDPVTLSGSVVDTTGAQVPGARLVLQRKAANGTWQTIKGVDGGDVDAKVSPTKTTTYRWVFVDRPLAAGSHSAGFKVKVAGASSESPGQQPSDQPSAPSGQSSEPSDDSTQPSDDSTQPDLSGQQSPIDLGSQSDQPSSPNTSQAPTQLPTQTPTSSPSEPPASADPTPSDSPADSPSNPPASEGSTAPERQP